MLLLAFVFYTSAIQDGFWKKFYVVFPFVNVLFTSSIFSSLNVISPEWSELEKTANLLLKNHPFILLQVGICFQRRWF